MKKERCTIIIGNGPRVGEECDGPVRPPDKYCSNHRGRAFLTRYRRSQQENEAAQVERRKRLDPGPLPSPLDALATSPDIKSIHITKTRGQ